MMTRSQSDKITTSILYDGWFAVNNIDTFVEQNKYDTLNKLTTKLWAEIGIPFDNIPESLQNIKKVVLLSSNEQLINEFQRVAQKVRLTRKDAVFIHASDEMAMYVVASINVAYGI